MMVRGKVKTTVRKRLVHLTMEIKTMVGLVVQLAVVILNWNVMIAMEKEGAIVVVAAVMVGTPTVIVA
jgi:hypothetical protein